MSPLLVVLLTFLAAAVAVAGICSVLADLFVRDQSRIQRRLDEGLRKRQRDQIRRSALFTNLGQLAAEIGAEEDAETYGQRFTRMLEQSALNIAPGRLVLMMVGLGLAGGMLVMLVRQSLVEAALAAILLGVSPFLYVLIKRNARMSKMASQLPHAFDLMARVIRAGQTMPQAILAVADEFDQPLAAEFTYCTEQQNLGLPPEVALRDLARRTGLVEVKIFVLALLVQQEAGGNLTELLEKLAAIMRDRFRIKDRVRALTAEGRMQALILLLLPPVILLIITLSNRNYAQSLLDHPGLLMGMFGAEAVGALWIRSIVNFDF
jgi:tight adherence protein B